MSTKMEVFFELILKFYIESHNQLKHFEGYEPWQLNVFVDDGYRILAMQYAYYDIDGNINYKETEPDSISFLAFDSAFRELEESMKNDRQKTDTSDVIFKMTYYFEDFARLYGYNRNIHFSICFIPLNELSGDNS